MRSTKQSHAETFKRSLTQYKADNRLFKNARKRKIMHVDRARDVASPRSSAFTFLLHALLRGRS
jgi:hypothetical protein